MIFELRVTNESGLSTIQSHTLLVSANSAPVIVTATNLSVSAGQYVSLAANESYDPDGHGINFKWLQTGGPGVELPWPEAHTIGFHAPYLEESSILTFDLTVTDALGPETKVQVAVEVSANRAPVLSADIPTAMASGSSGYINAWSSYDPEGAPLSYNWQYVSGPWLELPEADQGGFTLTVPEVKETQDLVLRLTLKDQQGLTTQQDFTISIVANLPPVVSVDQYVSAKAGEFLVLDASNSRDPEGESVWFYWQQTAGEAPHSKWGDWTSQLNVQLAEEQTGVLTFQVTVTDGSGKASSRDIYVTIN
jgi:hypothetical protein